MSGVKGGRGMRVTESLACLSEREHLRRTLVRVLLEVGAVLGHDQQHLGPRAQHAMTLDQTAGLAVAARTRLLGCAVMRTLPEHEGMRRTLDYCAWAAQQCCEAAISFRARTCDT